MDILNILEAESKPTYEFFKDHFGNEEQNNDSNWVSDLTISLLKGLNKIVLNTPNLLDNGIFERAFSVVWGISNSFLLIMLGINGAKMVFARANGAYVRPTEFLTRLALAGAMTFLSMPYIKNMIDFSNIICQVIVSNIVGLEFYEGNIIDSGALFGLFLMIVGLVPATAILFVRWAIRVVYLVTISVCSPIACLSWVNPNYSGVFSTWFKEVNISIFTPCIQALFYGICSNIIVLMNATQTSIAGAPLSMIFTLACLVLMIITPEIFRKFMYNSFNPLQLLNTLGNIASPSNLFRFISRR